MYDILQGIMKYECGEMESEEIIEFFKELEKSSMIDKLQGHYGRTYFSLKDQGLI
jgi:hypothetical protein